MRSYLDDDVAGPLLAQFLRNAGHDVRLPAELGLSGADDAVHLTHAIREDRVSLSRNYRDFENLHNLLAEARGHHPGILAIRRDDNTRRNMSPRDIVRALRNLLASGLPFPDHYRLLNPWQ